MQWGGRMGDAWMDGWMDSPKPLVPRTQCCCCFLDAGTIPRGLKEVWINQHSAFSLAFHQYNCLQASGLCVSRADTSCSSPVHSLP